MSQRYCMACNHWVALVLKAEASHFDEVPDPEPGRPDSVFE